MSENLLRDIKNYFKMEKEGGIFEYLFSLKSKDSNILSLKNQVLDCKKCSLSNTRKKVVFGEGNIHARLMFVGEAPGHEEDIQGCPFVGDAGMLLTKIIESMGMKREDVYICNILKCRPPQNRNPLPEEIPLCLDYLYKQIEYIKPEIICGLGKFASQTLLNSNISISKLRGNWHSFRGIRFMPTFHPAYLLRNPKDKKLVWQDMKKIMELL